MDSHEATLSLCALIRTIGCYMHTGLEGDNEMKIDIPVQPRKDTDFPSYVNWYLSNILIPYPLYIITTVGGNGVPNAQPNSWGLPMVLGT